MSVEEVESNNRRRIAETQSALSDGTGRLQEDTETGDTTEGVRETVVESPMNFTGNPEDQ